MLKKMMYFVIVLLLLFTPCAATAQENCTPPPDYSPRVWETEDYTAYVLQDALIVASCSEHQFFPLVGIRDLAPDDEHILIFFHSGQIAKLDLKTSALYFYPPPENLSPRGEILEGEGGKHGNCVVSEEGCLQ